VIWFYFFMPEMSNRTLEELDEMFLNKVSVRNFRKYQCQIRDDAVHRAVTGDEEKASVIAHEEEVGSRESTSETRKI
jgi:hypothetical protein